MNGKDFHMMPDGVGMGGDLILPAYEAVPPSENAKSLDIVEIVKTVRGALKSFIGKLFTKEDADEVANNVADSLTAKVRVCQPAEIKTEGRER